MKNDFHSGDSHSVSAFLYVYIFTIGQNDDRFNIIVLMKIFNRRNHFNTQNEGHLVLSVENHITSHVECLRRAVSPFCRWKS
jgi:hypothetical protein